MTLQRSKEPKNKYWYARVSEVGVMISVFVYLAFIDSYFFVRFVALENLRQNGNTISKRKTNNETQPNCVNVLFDSSSRLTATTTQQTNPLQNQ